MCISKLKESDEEENIGGEQSMALWNEGRMIDYC
jgi:hypothetical protein